MTQQKLELVLQVMRIPGQRPQFFLVGPGAPPQPFTNEAAASQWARTHGRTVRKAQTSYNGSKTCTSCDRQINPVHAMLNSEKCEPCRRDEHTTRIQSRMAR